MKKIGCVFMLLLCTQIFLSAQETVIVNKKGVLFNSTDKSELALFGVNYCLPSACDYRAAGYVGADRKKLIDTDMTHLKRMGFNAIRLTFWGDWENSDTEGNLLDNDHLDLLDYLISVASKNGFKMLLSPIVTYGSNWPDNNHIKDMPGFSAHTDKWKLVIDSTVIAAEQNYMTQLLNHKNRYTGNALKNETQIFAIEIINEPTQHTDKLKETTGFINKMYDAIRATGCKKVVCFNLSQDFRIAPAIRDSKVEGATYAWYPTALNNGYTLKGNFLPFVANYEQMRSVGIGNRFKLVYEFDVPDVNVSYLYPAMAREYREGGAQFAAMFSYDMLATARYNLGWQSHNMNMVYTPQKAISAMIAAKVMKVIPRGADFGAFPKNNHFGPFTVDYEKNLSVFADKTHLYYSNTIDSDYQYTAKTLTQIVGYGSSPAVITDSKGIYFLDKIKDGLWRLELYPDAIEVSDPFNMPNLNKVTQELISQGVNFKFNLPDFNQQYYAVSLTSSDVNKSDDTGNTTLTPGLYLISTQSNVDLKKLPQQVNGIGMRDMIQPEVFANNGYFIHKPAIEYSTEGKIKFKCQWVANRKAAEVQLYLKLNGGYYKKYTMQSEGNYLYSLELNPKDLASDKSKNVTESALLEYIIVVKNGDDFTMYPSGQHGTPWDWDFNLSSEAYVSKVVKPTGRLNIFNVEKDKDQIRKTRIFRSLEFSQKMIMDTTSNQLSLQIYCPNMIHKPDFEYPEDISVSTYIQSKLKSRVTAGLKPRWIEVRARKITATTDSILIGFNQSDAACWGAKVPLNDNWETVRVPVDKLQPTPMAMLPQDWPGINPYYYPAVSMSKSPEWKKIENIFVSIRDGLYPQTKTQPKGYEIQSIDLIF